MHIWIVCLPPPLSGQWWEMRGRFTFFTAKCGPLRWDICLQLYSWITIWCLVLYVKSAAVCTACVHNGYLHSHANNPISCVDLGKPGGICNGNLPLGRNYTSLISWSAPPLPRRREWDIQLIGTLNHSCTCSKSEASRWIFTVVVS